MRKKAKPKRGFERTWVFESLESERNFFQKRMFGGLAVWLDARMVLVLVEDPGERSWRERSWDYDIWDGLLLPTHRKYHAELMAEFPSLEPHPVLGKWLYLRAEADDFEDCAGRLAACILDRDPRLGIESKAPG